MTTEFKAIAIHNPVPADKAIQHETLHYNLTTGFSWLRGRGDEDRSWHGNYRSAYDAEKACVLAGFSPTAVTYPENSPL